MSLVFTLKSPAESPPNKKVSLPFEALKPGTDFSSPAMKFLDWHLLPTDDYFVYVEICCLLQPPSQITLPKSSGQHVAASTWTLPASSWTFTLWRCLLSLNLTNQPRLASAASPLSFTELEGVSALLCIRLWLKGMLRLVWSVQTTKSFSVWAVRLFTLLSSVCSREQQY